MTSTMKLLMRRIHDGLKDSPVYVPVRKAHLKWSAARWTEGDEAVRRMYSRFLRPGDLVFDIGANVGQRVKVFARMGVTVVAVEPQDVCMTFLRSLYLKNP